MKPEPIYRERLARLADFLDALPPERFRYDSWVGATWGGKADLSCGTTACAMGWATTIHEFRELGMRLTRVGEITLKDWEDDDGNGADEYDAARELFGLSVAETEHLFIPAFPRGREGKLGPDASAQDVAGLIRTFLAEKATPEPSKDSGGSDG